MSKNEGVQSTDIVIFLQEHHINFDPTVLEGIGEQASRKLMNTVMQGRTWITEEVIEGRQVVAQILGREEIRQSDVVTAVRYDGTAHIGTIMHLAYDIQPEENSFTKPEDLEDTKAGINFHLSEARQAFEAASTKDPLKLQSYLGLMVDHSTQELGSGRLSPLDAEQAQWELGMYTTLHGSVSDHIANYAKT